MQTLDCIAGHQWERPATRGRPPVACPEHKTDAQRQAAVRHQTFYVPRPPRERKPKARSVTLSPEERSEKARLAARSRWKRLSPAERSAAASRAAQARFPDGPRLTREPVVEVECSFCGVALRGAKRKQCGDAECERRYRAERARRYMHERRARLRGNDWERFSPVEVYERDGWICGICNKPVDRSTYFPDPMSVSLDHVIPVSLGGPHTRANTRCAHFGCNSNRGNRAA